MSEKETYELKEFIWLNVFGWIRWTEEEYPHRSGFALGDDTGEKCLELDMVDPLSPEGSMEVLKKSIDAGYSPTISRPFFSDEQSELYFVKDESSEIYSKAETLELAICLFSRKLFDKSK
jgi:hypothetical protein